MAEKCTKPYPYKLTVIIKDAVEFYALTNMTSPLKRIELHPHEAKRLIGKLWPILAGRSSWSSTSKQIEIERTKVRLMPKEVDVKLRCQLRRGLSSIFEAKPIFEIWVYYLTFLKLRLMTRSIIGLRFWETFYQLLKWKKLKGMSKSIKNCANYLRNINSR